MTETALGETALAQMCCGTDEAMFAGLLLLTKCSHKTIETLSHRAAEILLGARSEGPSKSSPKRASSNFLCRLLLTKSSQDDSSQTEAPLSQIQLLGLDVVTTLGQTGSPEVRRKLALSLGASVTDILSSLVDLLSERRNALDLALESTLECLLVMFGEGPESVGCADIPPRVMPALVSLLRSCSGVEPLSKTTPGSRVEEPEDAPEVLNGSDVPPAEAKWARVVSHAHELARRLVSISPPLPASDSPLSNEDALWKMWAEHITGVATGLVDQHLAASTTKRASSQAAEQAATTPHTKSPGDDEPPGGNGSGDRAEDAPSETLRLDAESQVGIALSLVLEWATSAIGAGVTVSPPSFGHPLTGTGGWGLPLETRNYLEEGAFSSSLRRSLVVAFHGGAPEPLRDLALRTCSAVCHLLGGAWIIEPPAPPPPPPSAQEQAKQAQKQQKRPQQREEGEGEGRFLSTPTTTRGGTACLFLGVTATELRLLVDEALALASTNTQGNEDDATRPSSSSSSSSSSFENDSERSERILNVLPVCLEIVEHVITFLCDDDGDDDDEDDDDVAAATGSSPETPQEHHHQQQQQLKWRALPSASLLQMQQILDAVAKTIVEFLKDARVIIEASPSATSASAVADSDGSEEHGRRGSPGDDRQSLLMLVLACGRCLSCWITQDTGGAQLLRKELSDANALSFLLSLSAYSPDTSLTTPLHTAPHRGATRSSEGAGSSGDGGGGDEKRDVSGGGSPTRPVVHGWEAEDDDSVDSDDEIPPPSPLPPPLAAAAAAALASPPPPPPSEGEQKSGHDSSSSSSSSGSGFMACTDVLHYLLPALTALCDGSEDGPTELAEVGAHAVVCAFVGRELRPALLEAAAAEEEKEEAAAAEEAVPSAGGGGGLGGEMLMPLVWALELLIQILGDAAGHIVSEGDTRIGGGGGGGGARGVEEPGCQYRGRLVDHPCFQRTRHSILDASTSAQHVFTPTIRFHQRASPPSSSFRLAQQALDRAVTLFLVIERHASSSSTAGTSAWDVKATDQMISALLDRLELRSHSKGGASSSSSSEEEEDGMITLARSLATSR